MHRKTILKITESYYRDLWCLVDEAGTIVADKLTERDARMISRTWNLAGWLEA